MVFDIDMYSCNQSTWAASDMPSHLAPACAAFAASFCSGSGMAGAVHPDFSSKLIAK
jgi:hypothetical protein